VKYNAARLVLTAELIPAGLSGKSLKTVCSSAWWRDIRQEVIETAGLHCAICGATERLLHAHEVWSYIDAFSVPQLDLEWVEAAIAAFKSNEQKRLDASVAKLNEIAPGKVHVCTNEIHSVECQLLPSAQVMICTDFDPERPLFPKVAALNHIQALCRLCHVCKHYRCDAT
jgi:hypothetical protein